jgi:type II secretory pathway component PulJ
MRRSGYLIIEMLVTLSLMVFVFAAAGELFRATILTCAASDRAANQSSRLDAAMLSLRRDVWQCDDIQLANPRAVELTLGDGKKVAWQINADASIQRIDPGGRTARWDSIGRQLQFVRDGATLVVTRSGPPGYQQLPLASQVLIAGPK